MEVKNGFLLKPYKFVDRNSYPYALYPDTYKHIKIQHCIEDPIVFIQSVFDKTFAIFESKRLKNVYLYYGIRGNVLYRVVVVDIIDRKIKTAYNSDVIKEGDLKWINKKSLLR